MVISYRFGLNPIMHIATLNVLYIHEKSKLPFQRRDEYVHFTLLKLNWILTTSCFVMSQSSLIGLILARLKPLFYLHSGEHMTKKLFLRLFLLSVMVLALGFSPAPASRASRITCIQCSTYCFHQYEDCYYNSPPSPTREHCEEVRLECQQTQCIDTGICPIN